MLEETTSIGRRRWEWMPTGKACETREVLVTVKEVVRGHNNVSILDVLHAEFVEVNDGLDDNYLEGLVCELFDLLRPLAHQLRWDQDECFSQFLGLLFRYDQTVEMPVQQFILTRLFIHFFFYRSFFCLVQIHNFITFSMFFHSLLRSFKKELFLLFFGDNAHYCNKFIVTYFHK